MVRMELTHLVVSCFGSRLLEFLGLSHCDAHAFHDGYYLHEFDVEVILEDLSVFS